MFATALSLVTQPPGSFVYHLVALLALEAALFVSLGQWWRGRESALGRLAFAAGAALVGRVVLLAASLLAYYGLFDAAAVLPPLDRAVSTATLLVVSWALIFPRQARAVVVAILGFLILTGMGYAVSAIAWFPTGQAGGFYNGTPQETIWEIVQIGLLAIGLAALLLRRPDEWGAAFGFLIVLLIGHLIHFFYPFFFEVEPENLPGAVRLAELAALPLLAVLAYRRAISQAPLPTYQLPIADSQSRSAVSSPTGTLRSLESPAAAPPPTNGARAAAPADKPRAALALKAAPALAAIGTTLDPRGLCEKITAGIGQQMLSDLTMLLTPPDEKGLATVACAYDLIRELHEPGYTLATVELPTIHSALTKARPARLAPSAHAVELAKLTERLGVRATGPAMIIPIVAEGRNLGALMVLSPYSGREWNSEDQSLMTALVPPVAAAVLNAQKYSAFDARLAQAAADLETARAEAHAGRATADRFALALEELKGHLEQETERAERLAAQLQGQSEAGAALEAAVTERARLEGELRQSQAKAADLQAQVETAEAEAERARAEAARAEGEVNQAQALAAEIQAKLAAAPKAAPANGQPGNGEVIASIAQELRQPMSSISGYTDLLLGESVGILGALQHKFLERVKSSTERMGALLDDLVRVTAIDAGTLKLEPAEVDVTGVIDDAITGLGAQFREKGLTLRMDIADDLPTLKADRDAIYQIVSHLLSNAGAASSANGEIVLTGSDQAAGDEHFLYLSVKDAGGGIPPEDIGRVFSRLYRADNPLIPGLGETGVGLSIAKALVEAHGGRIWVETDAGVGSTFSVLLPVEGAGVRAA